MLSTAYCINLAHRTDRWVRMRTEMLHFPEEFELRRFDAIRDIGNPRIGCAESHLSIVREAQERQDDFVFVLEDDVVFSETSFGRLKAALQSVPKDWDILLGGCYDTRRGSYVGGDVYKVHYAQSLHCAIYRKSAYSKILAYDQIPVALDDYFSYLAATREINLYHIYPMVACQRKEFSDIKGRVFDFNDPHHDLKMDYFLQYKVYECIYTGSTNAFGQYIEKMADPHLKAEAMKVAVKYLESVNGCKVG